ncbi:MAG: response regulator, partial [Anaerolineae bacterium]|nr:response regulator [Anaerolineae bacterium]
MKRALIIEDDPSSRSIWGRVLAEQGYECVSAEDVEGAQPLVAPDISLYLVDEYLPDGRGTSLIPRIRATAPESIVIIISMDDDSELIHGAFEGGSNLFVVKPAEPTEMRRVIAEIDSGQ